MKSTITLVAAILFTAHLSFAQTASFDLAFATPAKTDSTQRPSTSNKAEKPVAGIAAKHSNLVISGIQQHLAQALNYTDLMVTNGVEGEIFVEITVSKTGAITPTIVKSLSEKMDEAVLAAINQMPAFSFSENGYQGARRFQVPVKFTLQ